MQLYAPAETARPVQLRILDSPAAAAGAGVGLLDELVGQLADLVADRVAARLAAPRREGSDEWLDTRRAAEYLGIHRDSVRRLAAELVDPDRAGGRRVQALLPTFGSGRLALFRVGAPGVDRGWA